jgi:hypothetical protein
MKLWALAATLVLITGCATLDSEPAYLDGQWGGPHIAANFHGGLADIQFDCASGSIDALIYPAKDGTFQAKGTYREGSPGPVRVGQIFRSQPATYSGNVTEDVMTLNVALEDGTMVGPFTLALGAQPQVTRCL